SPALHCLQRSGTTPQVHGRRELITRNDRGYIRRLSYQAPLVIENPGIESMRLLELLRFALPVDLPVQETGIVRMLSQGVFETVDLVDHEIKVVSFHGLHLHPVKKGRGHKQ